MPVQRTDRTTPWLIDSDGKTFTLAANATIDVADTSGIADRGNGNEIRVLGTILADGHGIQTVAANVFIDADGKIAAAAGILAGTGGRVENHGHLLADSYGVYSAFYNVTLRLENTGVIDSSHSGIALLNSGTLIVTNSGTIQGEENAIEIANGRGTIVNGRDGILSSAETTIEITQQGGAQSITNKGLIQSGDIAISATDGNSVTIVNTGMILGSILLGNGADRIDTREGVIRGEINGGEGDDTYLISRSGTVIVDMGTSQADTVRSTASFTLTGGLDDLRLLGDRNIDGSGNAGINFVSGNAGNNRLDGGPGRDSLFGGAGKDILIGGINGDFFYFDAGSGIDRIADFTDGEDTIASTLVTSERQFNRLDIRQSGDDTVIDFGKGDRLILENFDRRDLEYKDFSLD
jgi:Ca2+-binding RTX toxin-like protein